MPLRACLEGQVRRPLPLERESVLCAQGLRQGLAELHHSLLIQEPQNNIDEANFLTSVPLQRPEEARSVSSESQCSLQQECGLNISDAP